MEEITIDIAKNISEKTGFPEIVIFGYDPTTNEQHVTTFGKTKQQSLDAARAGNEIKKHLGWSENQCHSKPDEKTLRKKDDNKTYKIFRFYKDFYRNGVLESVFIATQEEVNALIGKHLNLGEVLGKHSEVCFDLKEEDIELVSDNQELITAIDELNILPIGHNLFSGYRCDECGDILDPLTDTCGYCEAE